MTASATPKNYTTLTDVTSGGLPSATTGTAALGRNAGRCRQSASRISKPSRLKDKDQIATYVGAAFIEGCRRRCSGRARPLALPPRLARFARSIASRCVLVGGHVSRKSKLSCFAAGLRLKVGKRHANESNAFGWWECRSDKIESRLLQLLPRLNRHLHRPAAGRNLKVGPFDFHGDRSSARVRFFAPGPDIRQPSRSRPLRFERDQSSPRRKSFPTPMTFVRGRPRRAGRLDRARSRNTNFPPCRSCAAGDRGFIAADRRPSQYQGRASS
jgi:hypothetical protein